MFTRHIVKVVLFNKDGQVLMVRRSKTDVRRPLQWDLPGGYKEPSETIEDCVVRETQEETGLSIQKPQLVFSKTEVRDWIDEQKTPHTENVVFFFFVGISEGGEVQLSHEHDKYQWADIDTAIKEYEYPLHLEVLKHVAAHNLQPALSK